MPGNKLGFGKMLGELGCTMGLHSDGSLPGSGFPDAKALKADDVVGVGWVFKARSKREDLNYVFFTVNGEEVGPRFWSVRTGSKSGLSLAPAITAYGATATFSVNFGQRAFANAGAWPT